MWTCRLTLKISRIVVPYINRCNCFSRSGVTAQEAQRRSGGHGSSHSQSSDSAASGPAAARSNSAEQRAAKQSPRTGAATTGATAAGSEQRSLTAEQVPPAGVRPPANNDGN